MDRWFQEVAKELVEQQRTSGLLGSCWTSHRPLRVIITDHHEVGDSTPEDLMQCRSALLAATCSNGLVLDAWSSLLSAGLGQMRSDITLFGMWCKYDVSHACMYVHVLVMSVFMVHVMFMPLVILWGPSSPGHAVHEFQLSLQSSWRCDRHCTVRRHCYNKGPNSYTCRGWELMPEHDTWLLPQLLGKNVGETGMQNAHNIRLYHHLLAVFILE